MNSKMYPPDPTCAPTLNFSLLFFKNLLQSVITKQNMFSKALFHAESGYEISFCQKWQVQQCCQFLIIKTHKNRVVGNPENFKNSTFLVVLLTITRQSINPEKGLSMLLVCMEMYPKFCTQDDPARGVRAMQNRKQNGTREDVLLLSR